MYKELKKQIIQWLFDNENVWQRTNSCIEEFKPYIYNKDGEYLIGGKDTMIFIEEAEELIYSQDFYKK